MVIFLNPTERELVLGSGLNDPRHTLFPGTEPEDNLFEDGLDDSSGGRAAAPTQVGVTISINAASRYWTRNTPQRVALLATHDDELRIVGVARGEPSSLQRGRGHAVIEISSVRVLQVPIRVVDVSQGLRRRARRTLEEIAEARVTRSLPPAAASEVFTRLVDQWPGFADAWNGVDVALGRPRVLREPPGLPQLDAQQTALRLFSPGWHRLTPTADLAIDSTLTVSVDETLRASENDYITDDATSFLDWQPIAGTIAGWHRFRDGSRTLSVKNVNVSSAESVTGADLVYLSRDPDVVVLVQYKLLEVTKSDTEPVFRDGDGRLADQVTRMLSYSRPQGEEAEERNVRLSPDIGFVKFILPGPIRSADPRDVTPAGRYVPARAAQLRPALPEAGPRGGKIYRPTTWRSLDGESFVRLVRDQWVGSVGTVTVELKAILGVISPGRPLTIAVDEPEAT